MTAPVRVLIPLGPLANQVQLALSEPPEGIAIQEVARVRDGLTIWLRADADKVKPGLQGNLIVDAFIVRAATAGQTKQQASPRRQPLGTLPAIPFEIVRP